MLHEDDRYAAGLAESAVGEADSVSFDELRRHGLVAVLGHWRISLTVGFETTRVAASDHAAVLPPLILMIWPVTKDALSKATNTMASAISSSFGCSLP
jgi:hypothetical protein